jgi:hypothetical protein
MILEVVRGEGPVAASVVLRRVRDACGAKRAGSRIKEAFDAAVRALRSSGTVQRDSGGFLFLTSQLPPTVRGGDSDYPESIRSAQEVPPAELQLAIANLVMDAKTIDENELTSRVAALFGWNRRGPEIEEVLRSAVRSLVRRGTLRRNETRLEPND